MRIQLVCQFGEPVRGLSPYADALREALERVEGLKIQPVDYQSAYPAFLHPAEGGGLQGNGVLRWYSPASWWRVAREPADLMHIQHWAPPLACYLWPLARMASRYGKRVVITVHNPLPHEQAGVFSAFENRLLRSADQLLAQSRAGVDLLRARLGPHAPEIRRVAHGMRVASEPVTATREDYIRMGLDPGLRYVLLFGNLRGYKGVDVLLDAWQRASPQLRDARLVIAGRFWSGKPGVFGRLGARVLGTAADTEKLQDKLLDTRACRGVMLREGFQSDADIDALIRVSEFAVFPYLRFSGQSGAACRVAAMGRPVMVSRVGGLPELAVDGTWILDAGDSEGLAARIQEKLRELDMPSSVGARQLDVVRPYAWENVAHDHADIYRELA